MDDFLVRALLGGAGVALAAGPLGTFIVWRRMAYFGDCLAHAALLGVALGLVLGVDLTLGVVAVCAAVAGLLVLLEGQRRLARDTLLGIFAHGSLALGLIALAFLEGLRVDLFAYLFGDILAITLSDLAWIYGGGIAVLAVLALVWRPLLAITIHEELARVEGVPVAAVSLVFTLLIAVVIAVAMKIVGVLLITALLIIPAAAARRLARTPEQMAALAALAGALAVGLGLAGSLTWDLPSGPAVVVAAALIFAVVLALPRPMGAREGP
ncbi:MAG: metal ABC transporter permease [Alphaproteobacteria bacterium]